MGIPSHWRLRGQRLRLEGEICGNCEAKLFPPRPVCPECGHLTHAVIEIARQPMPLYTTPVPAEVSPS